MGKNAKQELFTGLFCFEATGETVALQDGFNLNFSVVFAAVTTASKALDII